MSSDPFHAASARRYLLLALKLAVSIVLLVVLFSRIDISRLWATARRASLTWLAAALGLYTVNMIATTWRWHLLLEAKRIHVRKPSLLSSLLVAAFFNNFLPSNIGGDVIRISDTAKPAGSKTLATTVVLVDRGLGLMALVFVAAIGASVAVATHRGAMPIWPAWLWAGFFAGVAVAAPAVFAPDGFRRLLQPLTIFHPEWVGGRIEKLTSALARFRARPAALITCFAAAIFVQATMVVFYFAVTYALRLDVPLWDLSVIVPISFVVQMLPISFGGFGVREATFSIYFLGIGQTQEAAIAMSLIAQALIMLFSLSGAAVYVARGHQANRSDHAA
ncbi:MAG: flippase-like domain-containing protein [Acidobacteria bacterium]|nr:flippase-like domain-containing protein [Acidobacteriota bacterium]